MTRFSPWWTDLAVCLAVAACGGAPRADAQAGPAPSGTASGVQDPMLPPPGFGSLRQDQVGIRLQNSQLAVRVIPLDERVTRLLAADAYRSLRDLKASRAAEIAAAERQVGSDSAVAFMVTFFGIAPDARFDPDALNITSQNATHRPLAIIPITPRWTEGTLAQRQQAAAIYLFEPGIEILRPMVVTYGPLTSEVWGDVLRILNGERARVLARAAQAQP